MRFIPSCAARALVAFFLALGIRLTVIGAVIVPEYKPVGDAFEYVTIAKNLVAGNGYSIWNPGFELRPTARRSPVFPLFLAGCFEWFGSGFLAPFVMLSVIGAATCVVLSQLAQRLFGPRGAWFAGLCAAATPGMWITQTVLMAETIHIFLLVTLVLFADRMLDGGRRAWVPVGVLAGLLALSRPEGLLVWGLLGCWILMAGPIEKRWRYLVCAFTLAALVVSPWVVRNFVRFGAFVPGSTMSGWVLAGANNPAIYEPPGALFGGWTLEFTNAPMYRECTTDPAATEPEYTNCWKRQALRYAAANKRLWPALIAWRIRRALDLWDPRHSALFEIPEGRLPALTIAAAVAFYPTLALACLGGVLCRRRVRRLFWLYAIPGFYLFEIAMTWGIQRLRAPMEPFLLLLATAAVVRLVQQVGAASGESQNSVWMNSREASGE
jgi:hypothetical protein